jgi:hypothetical protein
VETGRGVNIGAGVFVDKDARVVAIASSIGMPGGADLVGSEQDVKMNNRTLTAKKCLIR